MTRPAKSLLDPTFKYTPAANTDLTALFKRIRREQERQANPEQNKVSSIKRGKP